GGLAFALSYINWGSLDLRDSTGTSQGSFNDTDIALTAGLGMELAPRVSAGVALRATQQKVVNDLYTSLAGDLGLLWIPEKNLRFGVAYSNLGTPVGGNPLTGELKGGGSVLFELNPQARFLTALSVSWLSSGLTSAQAGGEVVFGQRWAIRAGYQLPFFDNQISGFTNFSAGVGIKFSTFTLDYAFLPFGDLGSSHRISLAYQFELPKEVVKVQMPVTVVQPPPESMVPPKDVEVHFKIFTDTLSPGRELEKEGKPLEAMRAYVEAIKSDPQNSQLWSALGRLYYQMGKRIYAIQCFEKVLKIQPDNPALRVWLERYKTENNK
ncbi:MAG TPA: tetratricopeptide repeat protein, partial [bacterium]